MMRSLFGLLVVIGALLLPGTVLADPEPPRPEPTPHAQRTALSGRVPVPSDSTVTLKAFNVEAASFKSCGTRTSFVDAADSPNTSSFELVLDRSCFEGQDGVFVCWSPRREDCALVAVSSGWRSVVSPRFDLPSFAELGPTLHTGLLTSIPTEPAPDQTIVPPEAHDVLPGDDAAIDDPAGADHQITDLTDSDQLLAQPDASTRSNLHGWLLWAGVAALAAGLAFGAGLRGKARRS